MKAQVSTARIQQLALAAFNGDSVGDLTEAERYFYDRAVAESRQHPNVAAAPLDL